MKIDDPLDEVKQTIASAGTSLDEVGRARLQASLFSALDQPPPAPPARARWRTWWPAGLVALGSAGLAVAATLLLAGTGQAPLPGAAAPAISAAPGFTRLEVPAGARIRTTVGQRATVMLIGPAEIEVLGPQGARAEARLLRGTLIGDYDHRMVGGLRIHSPGATTEVVGTLFAIEAAGADSRVSVDHGRVQVRDGRGQSVLVHGGQSWSSRDGRLGPLPAEVRGLLATGGGGSTPAGREGSDGDQPAPATRPRAGKRLVAAAREGGMPRETSPSAASLYDRAERALARKDQAAAREALTALVQQSPEGSTAQTARYELARLAMTAGDARQAWRVLDDLLARGGGGPFAEAASYLRCQAISGAGQAAAARPCFERFLAEFPASPRAPAARQVLDRPGAAR
jgi:TolA-binding protein